MPTRVAILGRTSSVKQDRQQTAETQIAVCEAYCSKNGLEVVGCYVDDDVRSSVPVEERPEASRLLRDAAAGLVDLVLVYAVDRLSRDRHISDPFLIKLKQLGVAFDSA